MDPYVQTLADLCRHFALFFRGGADEAWFKTWPQVAGVLLAPADATPTPSRRARRSSFTASRA